MAVWWCLSGNTAWALFRGDEADGRDFGIGANFFINRWTYEPWLDTELRFAEATNAFYGGGGSLTSDELYLVQLLKVTHPLGAHLHFEANYERDRDFDGSFQRFTTGLRYQIPSGWSVSLLGEPIANKAFADIGTAVGYEGARTDLRLQVLLPNAWYNHKNKDEGRQQRIPNVQWDSTVQLGSKWQWTLHLDLDPSRRWTNPRQGFDYTFEKYQGEMGIWWFPNEHGLWRLAGGGEWSDQQREALNADRASAFTLDRTHWTASLEYNSHWRERTGWRVGALYVRFDEDWIYRADPDATLLTDRYDRMIYAGQVWPLSGAWYLNTMALVNLLSNQQESKTEIFSDRSEQWQKRTAGSLIFAGADFSVEGGAAVNWHSQRFGGGFVKVFVDF